LQTRVAARQSVLIVVHLPPPLTPHTRLAQLAPQVFGADLDVHADTVAWSGIEQGGSHITQRMVHVRVSGRRCASPREATIDLSCATNQRVL
jgi:hypothetical protein